MSAPISSPNRRPLGTIAINNARPNISAGSATSRPTPALTTTTTAPTNAVCAQNPYPPPPPSFTPSQSVQRTPHLRQQQLLALSTLFEYKAANGQLLYVDRTGGGKSHVMRVAGTCVRGLVLCTAPTLALAADVFQKFEGADETVGMVDAIHFDEHIGADEQKRSSLIAKIKRITRFTKRTVFLFISPQKLAMYRDLRSALFICNSRKVLRMILIDEFHMHCQHGMDFRAEIKTVLNEFIRPLMRRPTSPYLVACTATCSTHNIAAFKEMSGIDFSLHKHQVWSPPSAFRQRNINMKMRVANQYSRYASARIVQHCTDQPDAAYAVFANIAATATKLHEKIEDALDAASILSDVVLVHGSLSPQEKFQLCKAFVDISMKSRTRSNVKGLVGTSAIDTGLDHMLLLLVILVEMPRDMLSFIQRRGRAGRQGEPAECLLLASFSDYAYTTLQIESSAHRSPENRHLTSTELRRVADIKQSELLAMMRLFCLNQGCWHCRCEYFCANGHLINGRLPSDSAIWPPCKTKCPTCTGEWNSYFRPISIAGLRAFLDRDDVFSSFPLSVKCYDTDVIVNLFWKNPAALPFIFDRLKGTIMQYHVQALS